MHGVMLVLNKLPWGDITKPVDFMASIASAQGKIKSPTACTDPTNCTPCEVGIAQNLTEFKGSFAQDVTQIYRQTLYLVCFQIKHLWVRVGWKKVFKPIIMDLMPQNEPIDYIPFPIAWHKRIGVTDILLRIVVPVLLNLQMINLRTKLEK